MMFSASPAAPRALIAVAALSLFTTLPLYSAVAQDAAPQFEIRKTNNALVKFGIASFTEGDFEKAVHYNNKALASGLSPRRRAAVYSNLCAALGSAGDLDGAMKACDAAIELRPNLSEAMNNRAIIHMKQGDSVAAKTDFTAARARKG